MTWILTISEVGSSWAGRPPVSTSHDSEEDARAALATYIRSNFQSELEDDPPEDDDDAIDTYFSEVPEKYTISQLQKGTR